MKERNKYILMGLLELIIVIVGFMVLNFYNPTVALLMTPFFIACIVIDFKLINVLIKKLDGES